MKKLHLFARAFFVTSLVLSFTAIQPARAAETEDFKGESPTIEVDFGLLGGLGWYGGAAGFALLGTVSKKLINRGFVPDLNDQVYLEAEVGPLFMSGATPIFYSAHLRWDFIRNDIWTPYALGGLSGTVGGGLGADWFIKPRLGVGTFWNVSPALTLRAEVSGEALALGVSFAL